MPTWANATGHALSSAAWLETHHRAKLPERTRFAQSLVPYHPRRLVDIGCGTGLWLDLIDKILPPECEFIGIDGDPDSLDLAKTRAKSWQRKADFVLCDIAEDFAQVPPADLILVFNMLAYIPNAPELLAHLRQSRKIGRVVIRQYDGGTMRVGPLASSLDRQAIDVSLHTSLEKRREPSHYDLDRAYQLAHASGLKIERIDFELTQRHSPFPPEFVDYFRETVTWMSERLADDARTRFDEAFAIEQSAAPLYFAEIDLVTVLSAFA